jgi:hypothetical protein
MSIKVTVVKEDKKPTGPRKPIYLGEAWSDTYQRWGYNTFYTYDTAKEWASTGREGQVYTITFEDEPAKEAE